MTAFQKVFLLFTSFYVVCKIILFFILYVITLRVEQKALEHKRHREKILRVRRLRNLEQYQQQYQAAEKRNRNLRVL